METSGSFYRAKLETYQAKLKSISKITKLFVWYRLAAFILVFIPLAGWGWKGWLTPVASLFFLGVFFFLVKKNIKLENQKRKFRALIKLVNDELLALNHQFSHFENGTEFIDPVHFNSHDLDLFGEDSVFQYINRTSTWGGKQCLAGWLSQPPVQKTEIEKRQEAVRELSSIPNWRLHFLAEGHLFKETQELHDEIKLWPEAKAELKHPGVLRALVVFITLLTMVAVVLAALGYSNFLLVIMVLVQWSITAFSLKIVSKFYEFFGRKSEILEKYMQLLRFVEDQNFQASYLIDLQKKVLKPDKASRIFGQLKKLVAQFDYRKNLFVAIILNSLFMWDLRCIYRLWRWHRAHGKKVEAWIETVAQTDAMISLANLAHNNPGFVYPEIHDGGFTFDAEEMGHPLLAAGKRVNNDFSIRGWGKIVIITGANMAGKSTFLRTVGVNLLLARTGAPVCAKKLVFSPVEVFTHMRTTDSLLKDESYFFAELKRIKIVLERLKKGEKVFVILDEMLKGTNSVDKLNGSRELIRKLLQLKAVALIATHDLKISEMENDYPQLVINKCFEIKPENDEMVFDYLLKDGITKTMNATFLMKKLGIIE